MKKSKIMKLKYWISIRILSLKRCAHCNAIVENDLKRDKRYILKWRVYQKKKSIWYIMHRRMCVINSRNVREVSSSGDIYVSIKTKRHRELSCIADGNVKWCSYCTKQPGGASEVKYVWYFFTSC